MAKQIETDQQNILDAIGDMSFLPPAAKDENLGRAFPKMHKGESIFRFGYACLFALCVVTFLILLFIYAPRGNHFDTSNTGNYGIFGILMFALCALCFGGAHVFGYYFDTKLSDNKDKFDFNTALHASLYYVSFGLLYVVFMTTCLRPHLFQTFFTDGFMQNFGTITLVFMLLITAGGILVNFAFPRYAKLYNSFILALGLWVVVCFSYILSKSSSMRSNYGILFLILGASCSTLSLPFYLAQKKTGMRSAFAVILSFTFFFETTAILDYAMVTLK